MKDRERAPEDDKSMYEFDDKEVLCAEIAGLCHDLGKSSCMQQYHVCMHTI
jgi:HD superfamily phosphohydrolase YqeK